MGRRPWNPRNASHRRAPPRRPATSATHAATGLPAPHTRPRWIAHAAYSIPGQSPLDLTPGRPGLAKSGEPPPREHVASESRRRPARPTCHSRLILILRPRTDPSRVKQTAYRSALSLLLKSPPVSSESTRGPAVFKSNYRWAQNFARTPLSFLEIEPAIQPWCFCELDLRTNV